MINRLLQSFGLRIISIQDHEALKQRIRDLISQSEELSSPETIVRKIMNRGIKWFDYNTIKDKEELRVYIDEAQRIADSPVFSNELKRAVYDIIQFIAIESDSHEKTREMRMTINGLELLRERLREIREVTTELPDSADNNF